MKGSSELLVALVLDNTKFESMGINCEYPSEFVTFVNLCLVQHHKLDKSYNNVISNICIVTYKVLAKLLLENNVDD